MAKRWDTLLVVLLLIAGFLLRAWNIATLPLGFSDEEITTLRLAESIRDGNVQVFFDTHPSGTESFFPILIAATKMIVGDGLFVMRFLPLMASLLTMALTFVVARRLFGRGVAFIALLAMLAGIWPIIAARTVTESALSALMMLVVLAAALKAFHLGRQIRPLSPTTGPYTVLAVAMAAAAYEHYTGLMAGIGIFVFVLYLRSTRQSVSRYLWWNSGYALLLALILALPYFISVLRNPTYSGPYIFIAERPSSIIALIESIGKTILGFFWLEAGDKNPAHNVPGLPLISYIEPVFLIFGIYGAVRLRRQANYGLLLIFFVLGLLPDMWLDKGPDYRALSFVSPLVYMLIGVGVFELVRFIKQSDIPISLSWLKKQQGRLAWPAPVVYLVALLMLLDFGANILRLRDNLFTNWSKRQDMQAAYHTDLGEIAHYLENNADGPPISICATPRPGTVADSRLLEWMLHRENIPFRIANCTSDLILTAGGSPMRLLFVDADERNNVPAPLLEWIRLAQPLENTSLPNGMGWIIDAEQALADMGGRLTTLNTLYYPRETGSPFETVGLPFRFNNSLTLIGIEPISDQPEFKPGDVLTVISYWRVDGPLPPDIGVFVRLHDTPQASPYNEINGFNVETKRLRPRDVVIQVGYLILPDTLRDQEYLLTLGVYEGRPTNQLPIFNPEAHQLRGNYLQISQPILINTED
ncbi:MAG: glycosyltransferase family 39 protein [Chloroflexi bacterium]|nr:glycosyltransferase family 39 protein [Chloroflexota bacterium]